MKWKKLGFVYNSDSKYGWNKHGAFLPTTMLMGDKIRIYCSMHDDNQVGRIGYVDVDAEEPTRIICVSEIPVLDIGLPGCFDDNGVTPASLLKLPSGEILLYYVGWQLGVKVRYYLFSGIAISDDNGETFRRLHKTPILDRNDSQTYLRTAPSIFFGPRGVSGINYFTLFYVGGSKWVDVDGKMVPTYDMYSTSSFGYDCFSHDGGKLVMSTDKDKNEFGFGRPQVIHEDNIFKMFYSIRYLDKGYRLGYAESSNGIAFVRKDNLIGIDVSKDGWDSKTISFAHVVDYMDKRYIFYNGTNGEPGHHAGIGCAVMEK